MNFRTGIGYDVHAFHQDRKLVLGGVKIPFSMGLMGHSDADVLIHAIMDALLGACGLDDIGTHFPDTDPAYSGISSVALLGSVAELLEKNKFKVMNIDSIIIAQRPRIMQYKADMTYNISKALKIQENQVSVKATTEEYLGFTGSMQGIKSVATCLVQYVGD